MMFIHHSNAQRILKWSVGKVSVSTESPLTASYELKVAIDDKKNNPTLGASTIRFFYDSNKLESFTIQDIANGYSQSGLKQSEDIFGDIFGFSGEKGTFVQFDIIHNPSNLLELNKKAVRVLNISFKIRDDAQFPICSPLVYDSHPNSWGQGKENDRGYLFNDSGISGTYILGHNTLNSYAADDEVANHNWQSNTKRNISKVVKSKSDRLGNISQSKSKCIKDPRNNLDTQNITFANGAISMYPVPFDDEVFLDIKLNYTTNLSIQIFDMKGSLILEKSNLKYFKDELFKQKMDFSNVDNQMFLVKIITDRNIYSKKIVSGSVK